MIKKILFKQSQLLRKQKVATGAVTWNWTPFQFLNSII